MCACMCICAAPLPCSITVIATTSLSPLLGAWKGNTIVQCSFIQRSISADWESVMAAVLDVCVCVRKRRGTAAVAGQCSTSTSCVWNPHSSLSVMCYMSGCHGSPFIKSVVTVTAFQHCCYLCSRNIGRKVWPTIPQSNCLHRGGRHYRDVNILQWTGNESRRVCVCFGMCMFWNVCVCVCDREMRRLQSGMAAFSQPSLFTLLTAVCIPLSHFPQHSTRSSAPLARCPLTFTPNSTHTLQLWPRTNIHDSMQHLKVRTAHRQTHEPTGTEAFSLNWRQFPPCATRWQKIPPPCLFSFGPVVLTNTGTNPDAQVWVGEMFEGNVFCCVFRSSHSVPLL